ncbi:amidohydrolase [Dehalococcoidia bacterium]|nr:amidohydrolase [Dehalococcoidia bacterium]
MTGVAGMVKGKVISNDDHVMEIRDIWQSRVEPQYKERAPRVVRLDDGDWWVADNLPLFRARGSTKESLGKRFEGPQSLSFEEFGSGEYAPPMRGGWDPYERVKDMDLEGLDVAFFYPTIGLRLYKTITDSALLTASFRAYNDWLADDFCGAFPSRLKGIAMINLSDVPSAVSEIQRTAKKGLPGAMIAVHPGDDKPYSATEYEPFWAIAEDLGVPISLHVGTNRPGPGQIGDLGQLTPVYYATLDHWLRTSISEMIFSGVFERHPKLQLGSIEHEASWSIHFLERMDYTYTQRAWRQFWHRFREDMLPGDYFRRNVFIGFQEDALAINNRAFIGVDTLHWGSDYPHPEGTFPHSREILGKILAECTEDEKLKIVGANAARVYNLD